MTRAGRPEDLIPGNHLHFVFKDGVISTCGWWQCHVQVPVCWAHCTFHLRQWWVFRKKTIIILKVKTPNLPAQGAEPNRWGADSNSCFSSFCSPGFLHPWPRYCMFPLPVRKEKKILLYPGSSLQLAGFCKEVVDECSGLSSWADSPSASRHSPACREDDACFSPSFTLTSYFVMRCAEKLCFVKVNEIFILHLISQFKA